MAIVYKSGNNIMKTEGRMYGQLEVLTVQGYSVTFPFVINNNSNNNNGVGSRRFAFTKPTSVSVDYGDGTVKTYQTIAVANGLSNGVDSHEFSIRQNQFYPPFPHEVHYYADGRTEVLRTVKITYDRGLLVIYNDQNVTTLVQPLVFRFSDHPLLTTFSISSSFVSDIDVASVTNNTNPALTSLNLSFFAPSSPYYSQIPLSFLKMRIANLTYGNIGYSNKTFAETNEDKLYLLATTLVFLTIASPKDAKGIPDISALPNLRTISFNSQPAFTTAPAGLNGAPWLTAITFTDNNGFVSIGDYSACVALTSITYDNCIFTTNITLPAYFSTLILLKTLNMQASLRSALQLTSFITSLYNIVTATASMAAGNTKFRQMSINVGNRSGAQGAGPAIIPGGNLQAPAGFVQGSNNGTPGSDLERIYVLVYNYAHTWAYRSI